MKQNPATIKKRGTGKTLKNNSRAGTKYISRA